MVTLELFDSVPSYLSSESDASTSIGDSYSRSSSMQVSSLLLLVLGMLATSQCGYRYSVAFAIVCLALSAQSKTQNNPVTIIVTLDFSLQDVEVHVVAPSAIANRNAVNAFGGRLRCGADVSSLSECPVQMCADTGDNSCFTRTTENLFTVGALIDQSGDFGRTGAQLVQAVLLGAENNDSPLYFVVSDTVLDPQIAVSEAERLYQKGVRLFLGPLTSAEATALDKWASSKPDSPLFIRSSVTATSVGELDSIFSITMDDYGSIASFAWYFTDADEAKGAVVYRDDVYGQDLRDLLSIEIPETRLKPVASIPYPTMAVNRDFDLVAQQLNDLVVAEEVDCIILFALDEVTDLLEVASKFPALRQVPWLGIGFNLDCQIDANPVALQMARDVSLRSLSYRGDRIGRNVLRENVLDAVSIGECTSPYAANSFDIVLLIIESARISRTQEISTIREGILLSSNYTYGASGWLGLNPVTGFRSSGEFSLAMVQLETLLDDPWLLTSFVSLTSADDRRSSFGRFQQSLQVSGGLPMSPLDFENCGRPEGTLVTITFRSSRLVSRTVSFNTNSLPEEGIIVPLLDDVTATFECEQGQYEIECPSGLFGGASACHVSLVDGSRDLGDTIVACAIAASTTAGCAWATSATLGGTAACVVVAAGTTYQCYKAIIS